MSIELYCATEPYSLSAAVQTPVCSPVQFIIASIKHQKLFGLLPITLTVQFLHIFRFKTSTPKPSAEGSIPSAPASGKRLNRAVLSRFSFAV